MANSMGLADSTEFSRMAEEIARMALSSPNPGEIIGKYQQNPDTKLAAFLANGMVQSQMGAKNRQQDLQGYNPNQPTVLDQMGQQEGQGVAGLPVPDGMFNPDMHQQGMAGGGVIAFAGEGPSLVQYDPETEAPGSVAIPKGAMEAYGKPIYEAATKYGLDPAMLASQIMQESSFNPKASRYEKHLGKSSLGLAQFMPGTGERYGLGTDEKGVDKRLDPAASIDAMARHMADNLKDANGSYAGALSKYNSGNPGYYKTNPKVMDYVNKITRTRESFAPAMEGFSSNGNPAAQPGAAPQATPDAKAQGEEERAADEKLGLAYESARSYRRATESNPPRFGGSRPEWETRLAEAKKAEEETQKAWEGTKTAKDANYSTLAKGAGKYTPGAGSDGVGKRPEYFAAKQEALQANPPAGYNALEYGAGIPSLMPPPDKEKTPPVKPAAPSIQEQYAGKTPPTTAAPAEDNTFMRDAGLAMIRGGLGTMASRNPARGFAGALQSFGEGNVPAIEGFAKMQQARAETAIKGDEKARDRAQKRFESLVKMKTQQLKSRLPDLTDPEEREARAYYEVLHTMTPKELAIQGITPQDLVNMKSSLGGSKGGSKGALKQNATGGFDYTPAKQ